MHYELKKDDRLLKQLGIIKNPDSAKTEGESALHDIFSKQGFSKEIADFIINNRRALTLDLLEEALILYQEKQDRPKPQFPYRKSKNPDYREQKIRKKHNTAEDKTYTTKERSVRDSKPDFDQKSWLRDQYTNDDQILVCQMCTNEMPFKLKNSSYHFEAVQISDNLMKEGHQLYLALCPVCAAKYRILVKRDSALLEDFITAIKTSDEVFEIPIDLGINGPHKVHFVEKHLQDLKTILTTEDELVM